MFVHFRDFGPEEGEYEQDFFELEPRMSRERTNRLVGIDHLLDDSVHVLADVIQVRIGSPPDIESDRPAQSPTHTLPFAQPRHSPSLPRRLNNPSKIMFQACSFPLGAERFKL